MARRRRIEDVPMSFFSFQDIMASVTGIMILVTLLLALDPLGTQMRASRSAQAATPSPARRAVTAEVAEALAAQTAAAEAEVAQLRRSLDARRRNPRVAPELEAELAAELERRQRTAEEVELRASRIHEAAERLEQEAAAAVERREQARRLLERAREALRRSVMQARLRFLPGERYAKAPLLVELSPHGAALGEVTADRTPSRLRALSGISPEAVAEGLTGRDPATEYLVFVVHPGAVASLDPLIEWFSARGWEVGWQLWDGTAGGLFDPPSIDAPPGAGAPSP